MRFAQDTRMLFLFEAGGLHPRMAYVLDGEPASTSRKPALVLVGSPCARVRSGSKATFCKSADDFRGRDASYLAPPAQIRTGPIRAYGLYGAFFVKGASRHFGRPLHSILLFDPRREHSSVPTAYFHRRRAQRRSRTALLQRRRRLVLDGREHGGRLPAIGWLAAR
jgi:hypothetical protein